MEGADYILGDAFQIDDVDTPVRLERAAGMLSHNERLLLFKLARDHYLGKGHIIDAGSFFGSSTVSLAEGLKANRFFRSISARIAQPIVSYDIGFLPAPPGAKTPITREFGKHSYTWGESFVPILKENIAGHDDVIDLRIGDFLEETWPAKRPIEICFIDLAKTNDLNVRCFRQLFPAFIPGRTLLVQQDFFFDRLPWIKVLMGHVAEHFEWLGQAGPSALYRYRSKIPAEKYAIDPYTDLPVEQRIACHGTATHPGLSPRRELSVALSLCYLLEAGQGPREALDELRSVRERFAGLVAATPKLQSRIERAETQFARGLPRTRPVQTKRPDSRIDFAERVEAKGQVTHAIRELTQAGSLLAHEQELEALYVQWGKLPWAGPHNERVRSEFVGARRAAQRKLNAEKVAAGRLIRPKPAPKVAPPSGWRSWLYRLLGLLRRPAA